MIIIISALLCTTLLTEVMFQVAVGGGLSHPEVLLNMLSPGDQDRFLQQFSHLNTEQQNYAFRQFINSRREIQQFAISQFLKLDPETLIVSVQAEIDREKGFRTNSRSEPREARVVSPQPPAASPLPPQFSNSINNLAAAPAQLPGPAVTPAPAAVSTQTGRPRQAELEAFRIAKLLQRQQREQLEQIIKQQNRINLQLQGQNVFL